MTFVEESTEAREAFERGDCGQAIRHIEAALAIAQDANLVLILAHCHRELRQYNEAIAQYQRYIELTPDPVAKQKASEFIDETLAALVPVVEVRSDPPGASVHLDDPSGPSLGVTPVEVKAESGVHRLYLILDGYVRYEQEIVVKEGVRTEVSCLLVAATMVHISSDPSGVEITFADNPSELVGLTPLKVSLTPGSYTIVGELTGYQPLREDFSIREGEQLELNLTLRPDQPLVRQEEIPLAEPSEGVSSDGVVSEEVETEGPSVFAWILGGAGLASIGGAIAIYIGNLAVREDYENEWSKDNPRLDKAYSDGLKDDMRTNEILFHALLWTGVALGVGSTLLFIFTGGEVESSESDIGVTPVVSPDYSGVVFDWCF